MTAWPPSLAAIAAAAPAALVGVLAVEGSAPRGPGTHMVVTGDALHGTIGGGQLEYRVIEQARVLLAQPPGSWRVQDYPLGPLLGQCCGGRVRLLIEHIDPRALGWVELAHEGEHLVTSLLDGAVSRCVDPNATLTRTSARGERPGIGARLVERIGEHRRPLYLFGAGHVGQAIARHAAGLPLRVAWFDTRPEQGGVDGVTVVDEAQVTACLADAPEEAAVLILTHDHGLDYRLTAAALARGPLAFIGLIGSATKRARFHALLAADGLDEAARARLTCPIGVSGIGGKEPDVIAVAALAQLLRLGPP